MGFWETSSLLMLAIRPADAMMTLYDPKLCYILDGFLGLYGLVITAMFIKEKFFKTRELRDSGQTGARGQRRADPERGRNNWKDDSSPYTALNRRTEDEYKELPVKRDRSRRKDLVYQGLSTANRDTYDSLQMQPFPTR
ncbi:T-cell surface glycoprotein CD3 zeta chain-like [Corythoichthys intestinalis]|uniref:T-cell surface glycoprotein CD3 zeta chain-like n=1 Tax=Corythoichthys intestinalis TaxID=161448 RepID=UPI0025A4D76E|nr:T-cell surface glycoprotein CD3 zeta chain-like [Corythoichthys intestinalis]